VSSPTENAYCPHQPKCLIVLSTENKNLSITTNCKKLISEQPAEEEQLKDEE
jgi:hypothetical protein